MKPISSIPFLDSPYIIYKGKFWTVILHRDNQSYLGRSIIYLHSRVLENPLEVTQQEHNELWLDILPRLEKALTKSFHPDRINYSHLGNKEHYVHWHIIPRYEKDPIRKFASVIFKDERAGQNYSPYPAKNPGTGVMKKIFETLKENFV